MGLEPATYGLQNRRRAFPMPRAVPFSPTAYLIYPACCRPVMAFPWLIGAVVRAVRLSVYPCQFANMEPGQRNLSSPVPGKLGTNIA